MASKDKLLAIYNTSSGLWSREGDCIAVADVPKGVTKEKWKDYLLKEAFKIAEPGAPVALGNVQEVHLASCLAIEDLKSSGMPEANAARQILTMAVR